MLNLINQGDALLGMASINWTETDLDLLRTLRGVYLRRSLVSVEESGCDARTKRMTRRRSCHPSRAPHSAVLSSHFPAAVEHREADTPGCYHAHRQ